MIDTAAHTAHAAGITDLSTFALLPATSFAALVEGGGAARTDCAAEWQVVNPTNTPFRDRRGRVSNMQSCHDGDSLCDGDGAVNGSCTFRVQVCINQDVAGCQAPAALRSLKIGPPKLGIPPPAGLSGALCGNLIDGLPV